MKLVFAHDHIFYEYENQVYSTGGLSKEMLERYTRVFDEVVVISRKRKIDTFDDNLTLASTDKVKFVEVPDFKSIVNSYKILKAKNIINYQIKNCDALIARLPSSIGGIAMSCAKRIKKPYIIELVACPWDALWNHSIKGKLVAPFSFFSTKRLVKNANHVLYVTNKFLQQRYPTSGNVVNCSNVALKDYDGSILNNRLEKICHNNNKKIIIGTTAALNVKYKGQQFIIKALGELKKQGITNFEYQLVGNGERTYLESIANKYNVINEVKFLGVLPHNEIFEWLKTIDIYAQPSRQEGLPRALIEAMSMALPSFGANTAGIPELLEEDYIFSNTRNNIREICSILREMNTKALTIQAVRNFEEAKKYDKKIIEARRTKFFKEFKKNIEC
ncbi:glycosyltransferase [Oceanobacillus massiliensis]|uniref:glycosyltransferase n=1 Tax=Oceanobacillus massiliensis TaxID=1465765 RepID=UPI000288CDD5|nr:glycosyltransferase [Oceanobacillus massiliensis]